MSSTEWTSEWDFLFISGEFLDQPIHREKEYLFRYFDTRIQRQFVRYYLSFRSVKNFTDHTGLRVLPLWLAKLRKRLESLEAAHTSAKLSFDTTTVAQIEQGRYKI